MLSRWIARAFVTCLALTSLPGFAADIAVMPVGLTLTARQDRQVMTFTNQGQETVVMQVDTVAWTQVNGQDRYVPSRDLLVNPPLFSIAPGESQIVRVGLRQPMASAQETAYRLFVRQVPSAPVATPVLGSASADAEATSVRVLLELRLPVYVQTPSVERSQQWRGWPTADGQIVLEMQNTGNVHQTVLGLKLRATSAAAPTLGQVQAGHAVLAGQQRRWTLNPMQAVGPEQPLVLEVITDKGPEHVALQLGRH